MLLYFLEELLLVVFNRREETHIYIMDDGLTGHLNQGEFTGIIPAWVYGIACSNSSSCVALLCPNSRTEWS